MPNGDPLPGFDDRAPRDRYCDLILTGGVTSAIAYPGAIFALAMAYRFNSIGGSSSGAGAAALAAAAEYRRRHGSSDGFRILLDRTDAISKYVDGKTGLEWLFQPAAKSRRLFKALVPGIAGPEDKLKQVGKGLLCAYAVWPILASVALALVIAWLLPRFWATPGWIEYLIAVAAGAVLLIVAVAAAAIWFWRDVRRVVNVDYGLCSGLKPVQDAPHPPPLTEWLHDLIQEIAGRKKGDTPLTFQDLKDAPGSPRETSGDLSPAGAVSIGLQMYTANVTQGLPILLPQQDAEPPLYFRPSEMRRLFPCDVVQHMKHSSPKVTLCTALPDDEDAMWELPKQQLPIVVASRMSVSFPVLFTAVPLWVRDCQVEPAVFRRCLFSDGGLCSNFPIHLFDCAVPSWPTFGISLSEQPAGAKEQTIEEAVTLPRDHREEQKVRRNEFENEPSSAARLSGFIDALLSTAKDWNDKTLARLPGVRDRVVQVALEHGTGGLNILMTGDQITKLGKLGGEAGRRLLERFAKASATDGMADGWNEHRWVRFNLLRECLSESFAGLTWSAAQSRYAKPLGEQIRDAVSNPPLTTTDNPPLKKEDSSQLLAAQGAALEGVLAALMQAESALTAPTVAQPYKPYPRPNLRIRPPL